MRACHILLAAMLAIAGTAKAGSAVDAEPSCAFKIVASYDDIGTKSFDLFLPAGDAVQRTGSVERCKASLPMKLYDCGHSQYFLWWKSASENHYVEKTKFFPPAPTQKSGSNVFAGSPGSGEGRSAGDLPSCAN